MKNTITEKTRITLAVAAAVGYAVWFLSAMSSDLQYMKQQMAETRADVKTLLKMNKTDVAGPVRTPAGGSCIPFNPGPFSMMER